MIRRPPSSTLFPSTTLFRSVHRWRPVSSRFTKMDVETSGGQTRELGGGKPTVSSRVWPPDVSTAILGNRLEDRKSTRLNSSHGHNPYAVFCFEKKKIAAYVK